jgi:hypothetical protein
VNPRHVSVYGKRKMSNRVTSKVFLREVWSSFSNFKRADPAPTAEALKALIALCIALSCASLKASCQNRTYQKPPKK